MRWAGARHGHPPHPRTRQSRFDETRRHELVAALERGKGLVRTAAELGAKETEEVEAEIVEAEGMLVEIP